MKNIEKKLTKLEHSLDEKLKVLETLEAEKHDIIKNFNNADEQLKIEILKQMKISEEKFKLLAEETLILKEKIKKLKKKFVL